MSNDSKINTYKISRELFDWCFENPDKVKPAHIAIYFYSIDMNNRFGWKNKFGFPTLQAMDATGIKSKNTYYKAFHELVEWGLIQIVTKSKNQNTANIISIPAVLKFKSAQGLADSSALDLANTQQEDSGSNVDKQINKETNNQKQESEFSAPTEDEVIKFLENEIGLNINAAEKEGKKFWSYYDSIGWKIGKNEIQMKNWKSSLKKWLANDFNNPQKSSNNGKNSNHDEPKIGRTSKKTILDISDTESIFIDRS